MEEAPPEIPEYPEDTEYHYEPILDPGSEFAWHRPEAQNQESIEQQHEIDFSQCHDPWMYYRGNIVTKIDNSTTQQSAFESQDEINKVLSEYRSPQQEYNPNYFESNEQTTWHQSHRYSEHGDSNHQPSEHQWERHQSHQHNQHGHPDHHPSEHEWEWRQSFQHSQHGHSDHQHSEHHWENNSRHHKYDYHQNNTHDTHAYSPYSSEQQWSYGKQSHPDNTNHYHNSNSLQSNSEPHAHSLHYHNENTNSSNSQEPSTHDSQSIQNKGQNAYTHYVNAYPQSHSVLGDHTQTRFDTRDSQDHESWVLHTHSEPRPQQVYQLHVDTRNRKQRRPRANRQHLHTSACELTNGYSSDSESEEEYIIPRHPYDGFYLKHRPTIDARGRKICSHEIPPAPSPSPSPESLPSLDSGSVHSEDYHTASECEEQVSQSFPKHTRFTPINTQIFYNFCNE